MSSEDAPPPNGDNSAAAAAPEPSSTSPSAPPPPPQQEEEGGQQQVISQVVEAPPPPPVYSGAAAVAPPPPRKVGRKSPSAGGSRSGLGDILSTDQRVLIGVAAAAGLLVLFTVALVCCCCCRRRRRKKNKQYGGGEGPMHYYYVNGPSGVGYYANAPSQKEWISSDQAFHMPPNHSSDMSSNSSTPPLQPPNQPAGLGGLSQGTFTYDDLAAATSGFSQANLLGQGGFGYVHKGVLPNGREIAVKSLKSGSGQGEREFQAEVEIISRVHHRHLVSLLGYCIAGGHRMLVYEYVPNNNLEFHLHGKGRPPMGWGMRLKVAKGAARGLAYLHEDCHPRIIHRDIKTANVLIDYNFDAQVADFGLAKLSSDNTTHVSTRIMGTFGYLAPEYACSGKLTEKSDVYSFGIMLLELITGRPPIDFTGEMEESLVDWARPLLLRALEDGNCDEFVDPRLEKNFDPIEMRRMVACAAASVRQSAKKRPKMSQIVRALEGDVSLDDLHDGVKPGQSTIYTRDGSNGGDGTSYSAEIRKFRKMVLDESQECTSSEYEPDPALNAKLK